MSEDVHAQHPTQMSISEMRHFILQWHAIVMRYDGAPAPAGAFFVMPAIDIARLGLVLRFFETIEPHAEEIRRLVAAAIKRGKR